MNLIEAYIQYLQEVNKIVIGLSNKSGKPKDYVDRVWKDTEKEFVVKHKFGVTDHYRDIGDSVAKKLGVKDEEDTKEK